MNDYEKPVDTCPMKSYSGSCLPCGSFCKLTNDLVCRALQNAYAAGLANSNANPNNIKSNNEEEV